MSDIWAQAQKNERKGAICNSRGRALEAGGAEPARNIVCRHKDWDLNQSWAVLPIGGDAAGH